MLAAFGCQPPISHVSRSKAYPHHREAIDKPTRHFEADKEPTAVYLGGSIAHGFERPDCDVDLIVVVDDEAYAERQFLVDSELNWLDGEPQVDDL